MTRLKRQLADRIPLTSRGFLVALFCGLSLWRFGFGALDLLLFVIGISGLALVVLSSATIGGAALYLSRRDRTTGRVSARRLEAGSPIATGFRLPALSRLPLVRIHWRWLVPAGVDCRLRRRHGELQEEVVATRRCQVAAIRRRITVYDAFGLASVVWERESPTPVTVLPNAGKLRSLPILQSMAANDGLPHPVGVPEGDRMEIRRYVPGDSVRHILWKTFARTRQLNVRIPERSIELADKTIAYLVAGPDDEAAAAAARVALESGVFGPDWLFGADGTGQPTDQLEPALEAIARSGSFAENGRHGGLSAFLAGPAVRNHAHCIVFAPCREGAWTRDALAAARNFSGAISFVVGTDGVAEGREAPWWHRLLFLGDDTPAITLGDLSRLLKTLDAAGCPALVVDRRSGRSFNSDHRRALRASA